MDHIHIELRFNCHLETKASQIEEAFTKLTEREDIGIILINQHVRLVPSSIQ